MKGKNTFTVAEADMIKKCLDDIIEGGSYDTLGLCQNLRLVHKFFIKDFKIRGVQRRFSSAEFDLAVAEGRITIVKD